MVPGVDRDDGSFVVFVNEDGEAVREDEFGVGNVGDEDVIGFGCGYGGFGFGSGVGLSEGEHGRENGGEEQDARAGAPRHVVHGVLPEQKVSAAQNKVRRKKWETVSRGHPVGGILSLQGC